MTDARLRARHLQQVEELCAAAIRALAGEADLHFRGQRLYRAGRPLPAFAPHLHPSIDEDDFGSFRGAADGIALRLAHSDRRMHASLAPADPIERLIFDLLEQLRVESLAQNAMPGLRRNLRHRFRQWSDAFVQSGLTESARGILLFSLAQAVRTRLSGEPMPERTADMIETSCVMLIGRIAHDLAALRRTRTDQRAFARHARAIATTVAGLLASRDDERGDESGREGGDDAPDRTGLQLLMALEGEEDGGVALADAGTSRVLEASSDGYRVFTRAYDREVGAETLVRAALLAEYRERLDARIAAQGIHLGRLARQLKALLATPQHDGWDGGQEDGRIDGRRIAQLIASPTERRLFRAERIEPVADCLVTFLVDCSGSMKGQIEPVAMIVDVFARALEIAGVPCEVLGFTTGAWNGGRAQRDWLRAGRPRHPGRLNEVCHMVFKAADTPWRRARRGIAALLKADLFREGVDGEAIDWAISRMEGRSERRRILLPVSDGSPMDAATHLANDEHYLDHHLRQVVQRHEAASGVEILGVGIGLDLSPYYSRSQVLDIAGSSGNQLCRELIGLIGGRRRR
ncbi:MAG: Aerobic cobaltochelatase CobT subunit [Burkholderiaceae bacterium]|nr:MAG: Aerobic cobaltochelatase CobT subunit [Burkholderiaceae bacterium]